MSSVYFFYGRPNHSRNAFELAVESVQRIKSKYGDLVEIVSAGADWDPKKYGLDGFVNNLGVLSYHDTGKLYRSCHIGLAMMITKHPSYLPFEMMACGVLVVSNYNPSTIWFLKDDKNCLLSYASASCIAETLSKALDNYDDLSFIRQNAIQEIKNRYSNWEAEFKEVKAFMINAVGIDQPKILQSNNQEVFGSTIFLVKEGRRHPIPDLDCLTQIGFSFPQDIQFVDNDVLLQYQSARPVSRRWLPHSAWTHPPTSNGLKMREFCARKLKGYGIECGAASAPFPIPLHCKVDYVDNFTNEQLRERIYPGQNRHDIVKVDFQDSLEKLSKFNDESLDFIVACHVIEHLKNPIQALQTAHIKLRPEGQLLLVIPDSKKLSIEIGN
ncbi:MAG: methyltransferase domain-containing protein [Leptolyngbyaceae cyanobacterium SL_5_14]|nr:methyltransferase domain-containing protein [Leptolyngbyaceae cyanobacterium SL_5_14]